MIILIKRWVSLIVIIIMQPCLWNAEYAIMYGLIVQESSIKSDNIEKSCGQLYSSSSSVRPISDICVSIGCSSKFLKQLYCQFSILILAFVSGKKKLLSPSCV